MMMVMVKSRRLHRQGVVPLVPAVTWYNLPLPERGRKSGEKGETKGQRESAWAEWCIHFVKMICSLDDSLSFDWL